MFTGSLQLCMGGGGETLGREEEEKPGKSCCDPLLGDRIVEGAEVLCPRSFVPLGKMRPLPATTSQGKSPVPP